MPTVQEALDRIWSDEALKNRLISDPKPVLREFGLDIPDSVTVQIHENTPKLVNAVLPMKPAREASLASGDPASKVTERAWSDSGFKSRLLANPADALAEMGVWLPAGVQLKVWENTATIQHIILPVKPAQSELSDSDLETVAGGSMSKGAQVGLGCFGEVISGPGIADTGVGAPEGGAVLGGAAIASIVGGAVSSGSGKC